MHPMQAHDRASGARRVLLTLGAALSLMSISSEPMAQAKHVVYIEASMVNRWNLDAFGARTGSDRYRVQPLTEYEFDKSRLVRQALAAGQRGPDAVVVQECAVYFPGDLDAYKQQYRGWISEISSRGLTPVIATVVPPARRKGIAAAKGFVKERLLGQPSRYEQVAAFNDWLRALGGEMGVAVFDLERLVRVDAEDRHMRDEYDEGDGVHLSRAAYDMLDRELQSFLDRMDWRGGPARK
jgi:hypothetical protein